METFGISPFAFWAAYAASNLVAVALILNCKKYPDYTKAALCGISIDDPDGGGLVSASEK